MTKPHRSKIDYVDYSGGCLNFAKRGQTDCPISPGCDNCYVERYGNMPAVTTYYPNLLSELNAWNPRTPKNPYRRGLHSKPLAFVCDTGDLFHRNIKDSDIYAALDLFTLKRDIVWILLTKRAERMKQSVIAWLYYKNHKAVPSHIWLLTTVENQALADERIPHLLDIPSYGILGISAEPLLEKLILHPYMDKKIYKRPLDWVIVGGETGTNARCMKRGFVVPIMVQCALYDIPFHFKQWGEYNSQGKKVGRAIAGDMLAGRAYKTIPRSDTETPIVAQTTRLF